MKVGDKVFVEFTVFKTSKGHYKTPLLWVKAEGPIAPGKETIYQSMIIPESWVYQEKGDGPLHNRRPLRQSRCTDRLV